jgi:hypothetical protein
VHKNNEKVYYQDSQCQVLHSAKIIYARSKPMPNFRKGKIYELKGEDPKKVYIGSTTQTLPQRKSEHVYSRKNPARDQHESNKLKGKLTIKLVEKYPTTSKAALERREEKVIAFKDKGPKHVLNKRR